MFKEKITQALTEAIGADATKKLEAVLEAVEAEIVENNKQVIEEHKASLVNEGNEKLVEAYEKLETEKKLIREEHEAELDALQQALESKAYDGYQQAADIIEKLNEEIAALKAEKAESEKIAYEGYEQAAKMIDDLKSENESLREEAVQHMEREFAVAKQKIEEAKHEAGKIEDQLFETYEQRLHDAKEAMVDLVDQFLKERVTEFDHAVQEELSNDEPQTKLAEQLVELAIEHGVQLEDVKIEERKDDGATKRLAAQLEALKTENKSLRQNAIKLESERDKAVNEAVEARRVITEETEKARRAAERAELLRKQESVEGTGLVNESTETETAKASGESGGSASGISEEIISEPQAQKKLQTESAGPANDWRKLAFSTSSKSAH